ncbi:hypothetical protein B0B39_02910 [Legionella longbeachae]|uniref:TrbI F-type domain-containing protein n=1 Tax=Legionella longbeachae TaxID=450 RepID=UPI000A1C0E38|nr:TrbI F-type domain-containing protein [Legionella longbeachae]ARM32540.1 hypothetical protein B0B39_02910 [Legionella longbeachae]
MVSTSKNLFIGLCVWTITWIFLFYKQSAPEIVTVDIAVITESFIKQEAQKNLSPQEKQQAVKRFSFQLEHALDELVHAHKHFIIVPKEAILKGAKDCTNQVRNLMHLEP